MILTKQDAQYASQVFIDYYKNFGRIDDYLRKVKLERMEDMPTPLFGYGPEDEMFQDFTMHPEDMQFVCREMPNDLYDNYLEIVTSHAIEKSVPGKNLKWVVYEVNTNKIVGFIRFGSPTINSKPRNDFLGRPLQTTNMEVMKRFNDSAIMGFIIKNLIPFYNSIRSLSSCFIQNQLMLLKHFLVQTPRMGLYLLGLSCRLLQKHVLLHCR